MKTTVYLATEYVEPLNNFMISHIDFNETITKHSISWGIYNIIVSIICIIKTQMLLVKNILQPSSVDNISC